MRLAQIRLAVIAAVIGAALGNLAARIWPVRYGAEHHCSSALGGFQSPDACRYPPHQQAHLLHLTLFGLIAAVVIVVIVELCRYEQQFAGGHLVR